MTAKEKEVAEEYSNALADLNINSKPLINMLTMLAEENCAYAPIIVQCIERQLHKVQADSKLPVLYLIDSVIKNIGQPYTRLFVQNIERLFLSTFIKVDEKTRANMFKLRSTWNDVIAPTKLHTLDVTIHAVDKNWPINAAPSNIHVNPKFLNPVNPTEAPKPVQPVLPNETDDTALRERFIKKQKELLELQQKKLELELLHTRTQLEMQKKKIEKINLTKNSSNTSALPSNVTTSPSNEEVYTKIQVLPDGSHKTAEIATKMVEVPTINSELPSMPVKIIGSPKKFQPTSILQVQQPFKNSQQPFVSQQQHSQMVASSPFINVNQSIPKINPVSTQLLQTLNRDPRLRKVENVSKPPTTLNDDVKFPTFKNKDEKKIDKPKRDGNKHRGDSRRKERSRSRSPSKKELSRKSHKRTDRKERCPRENKYHKRRDEKKSKGLEVKQKSLSPGVKVQQNEIAIINHEISLTEDKFNDEPKSDSSNLDLPIIEQIETNVPIERDVKNETIKEVEINVSELSKTDSPLEDSDSLKRLRMYMQTMKKSPEPSTAPSLELKNDLDIHAVKTNQNIIVPQNDIDLRVIVPSVKRTSDSIKNDDIEPAVKKSKSEIIDELFGAEDVDLRTLTAPPIVPSPPPPPQISETQISDGKSWVKYKEIKPDTFKPQLQSPTKTMPGELNDINSKDSTMDVDMRGKPIQSNKNHILRKAEEALNAGSISFDEYKKIMCQAIEMTEVEKLEETNHSEDGSVGLKNYTIPKLSQSENGNDLQSKIKVVNSVEKMISPESQLKSTDVTENLDFTIKEKQNMEFAETIPTENQKLINSEIKDDDKPMDIDERVNLKPLVGENFPGLGPWNIINKKSSDFSGSDSDCSSKSDSTGSEETKRMNKKLDADGRSLFKRQKTFRRNEKENSKSRWRNNNKNWNPRPENGSRFSQNRIEPWSRGPRPNYSQSSTRSSIVPPPVYEVPKPAPFAPSTSEWTVPVIPLSDPLILDLIANDATQTINIDGVSREVRFYGTTAITFVTWDDPREIYFQGPPRNVVFDDLFSVLCHFNAPDREFLLDCQPHRVRLGAPTRELYLDGKFYECFFGGPPIFTDLGGVKRSVKLEGPPPSVNIGTTKRQDLVAGRISIIIDNSYTVPVYLDAKPQRIDVGNTALIFRFIDGLMRALINDQPFKVNYNGPPQVIIVRGNKHYLRFTGLPSNIRPGYAAISQMIGVVLTEDTPSESIPPIPAPPIPNNFTGFDMATLTSIEDIAQPPAQPFSSSYSLAQTTAVSLPLLPNVISQLESVTSSYVPPVTPAQVVPPVLPNHMDINELFKKLVDSGIVPKDKPKEVAPPKIKKKEKEVDNLTIKPVDFSDPASLKQKQPGLIHNLYTGIQCSSCGIRFTAEFTIKYSSHLDWHFRQNRREKMASKTVQSRKWYYDTSDWCKYEEQEDETTRAASWFDLQAEQGTKEDEKEEEENVPCVPAGENSELAACYLCHDQFEQFYSEKDEEWQLKNCIDKDKRLYHPMCYDDMIKTREEKIRKRNEAIEEAKRLESQRLEINLEANQNQLDIKLCKSEVIKNEEEIKPKCEQEPNVKEEIKPKCEQEEIEEIKNTVKVEPVIVFQEPQSEESTDKNINENVFKDLEIPDTMEIIQMTEVIPSPSLIDESVTNNNPSPPPITQEIIPEEVKPKSPSPVSTMTCSIDGNTDTEWNVPVAPSVGTIKINISQKVVTAVAKPIMPTGDISVEPKSPLDTTPTFGEIDPDQPPPPGLEMETVVTPKLQKDMKPRLMYNVKKLKEYPIVNKGKEMSGLCSIM